MSFQSRQVVRLLPATAAVLSIATGYPLARVYTFIGEARAEGTPIQAQSQAPLGTKGGPTVFAVVDSTATVGDNA